MWAGWLAGTPVLLGIMTIGVRITGFDKGVSLVALVVALGLAGYCFVGSHACRYFTHRLLAAD